MKHTHADYYAVRAYQPVINPAPIQIDLNKFTNFPSIFHAHVSRRRKLFSRKGFVFQDSNCWQDFIVIVIIVIISSTLAYTAIGVAMVINAWCNIAQMGAQPLEAVECWLGN